MKRANLAKYLVLSVMAILFVAPLFWMIANSMKPENMLFGDMTSFLAFLPSRNPADWLAPYAKLLERFSIMRSVINSLVYSGCAVFGSLIVNSMAGYALSRYRFPFKKFFLGLIIALIVVPVELTTVPLFTIIHRMKMTNTYFGLVLPGFCSVFIIYLFKQFFDTIPSEYEEAAKMDGATTAQTFRLIIIPLSKPIFATVAIMTFVSSWNDYLWPLMVMTDNSKYPIQVAVNVIFNTYPVFRNQIMAALTIATIPMILVYSTMQKYITQGLGGVGIK